MGSLGLTTVAVHLFLTLTGAASGFLVKKFFEDLVIAEDNIWDSLPFSPAWVRLLFFLFSAASSLGFFLFRWFKFTLKPTL